MRRMLHVTLVAAAIASSLGFAASAQTIQLAPPDRLLSVTGEGVVRARPDMALITLGVVSEARQAGEALTENSGSMSRIIAALREQNIESRDLQTSGFSVEPVYSQPPRDHDSAQPFHPEIVGYRVHNNLTIRIRALDKVGALLDQVVTLGANSISGPNFVVADPTPLEDQARRAAVRDAMRKGQLYADAGAVRLGPVFRIEESFAQPPQPFAAAPAMRMEADSGVPIEGGELTIEARVSVSWLLAD